MILLEQGLSAPRDFRWRRFLAPLVLTILVAACATPGTTPAPTAASTPVPSAAATAAPTAAPTDPPVDFKGRTIRLVIPYGAGGTFDVMARLVADQLGKYLPGTPTVFVESVTGGGGLIGINAIYTAKELTLGHFSSVFTIGQIIGTAQGVAFEKFEVIGSVGGTTRMLATTSGIGLDQMRSGAQPVRFGGQGLGTGLDDAVLLAREIGGFTNVRLVSGYSGQNAIYLAMQQGEVQGGPASVQDRSASGNAAFRDMMNAGGAQFVLRIGGEETVAGVPSLEEFAKDARSRALVEAFDGMYRFNRVFVASPGTDPVVLRALRRALEQGVRDPAFISAAQAKGFILTPIIGDEAQAAFRKMLVLDSATADRLRSILRLDP